jgi:hypothetical protein
MRDCLQKFGKRWRRNEAWWGKGQADTEAFTCFCPTLYSKGERSSRSGRKAGHVGFVQLRQDPGTGFSGGETGGGRFEV